MANLTFEYLYRDAANYKRWGSVVYANPNGLSIEAVENRIREKLDALGKKHDQEGSDQFVAHQLGVPEVFLWNEKADYDPDDESTYPPGFPDGYAIREDDDFWHEFAGVEETDQEPTDRRTIDEFLADLEAVEKWETFDPGNRKMEGYRGHTPRTVGQRSLSRKLQEGDPAIPGTPHNRSARNGRL